MKYIGGLNIRSAIRRMQELPYVPIYDYARESSANIKEAEEYSQRICKDAQNLRDNSAFALKVSSFMGESKLINNTVKELLNHTKEIFLDAENNQYHSVEKEIYDGLIRKYNKDMIIMYKTYQMYRCDSMVELMEDMEKYEHLGIKLVRGAYFEQDIDKGVLYKDKQRTDDNYNGAIRYIIQQIKNKHNIKVVFATHNDASINLSLKMGKGLHEKISYAQLLDMNDTASKKLVDIGEKVYKYVPYGGVIETMPYLMRRFYENRDIMKFM